MKSYKTQTAKRDDVQRSWHLYDLDGKILGRASTEIARLLIGKHKPNYTPHIDQGDFVVVINAEKIEVTGKKVANKIYSRHSGYPGGLKQESLGDKLKSDATKVIELSVRGMLPKNKHQSPRLHRMKVYLGQDHPHTNHFKSTNETTKKEK